MSLDVAEIVHLPGQRIGRVHNNNLPVRLQGLDHRECPQYLDLLDLRGGRDVAGQLAHVQRVVVAGVGGERVDVVWAFPCLCIVVRG